MNKEEILLFLKENKNSFRKRFGIDRIALFGSFAKDRYRKWKMLYMSNNILTCRDILESIQKIKRYSEKFENSDDFYHYHLPRLEKQLLEILS